MKLKMLCVLVLLLSLIGMVFAGGDQAAGGGASKGPVILNLWHWWSGLNENVMKELTEGFNAKNPDVNVNPVLAGSSYMELLQKMLADRAAGNASPDLFIVVYNMRKYVHDELNPVLLNDLAPNPAAFKDLMSRYQADVGKLGEISGDQIGIPFALSTPIMYWNEDIFTAAGLTEADVPKTWEDVKKIGLIIKQKTGKYGMAIQIVDNWADLSLLDCNGGRMVTGDESKVAFNDPNSVEAIRMWQELHQLGIQPVSTDAELINSFIAGDIAMHVTTIMKYGAITTQSKDKIRVAEFPGFGNKPKKLTAGGSLMVSFVKDKKKYDPVWRFMDYAISEQGMKIWTKTGYLCPIKAEVPIGPGQDVAYRQFAYATPWANWPGGFAGLEIDRLYVNKRTEIIQGNLDPQKTLDQLAIDCNRLLQ
jgi:multiple sugar transport system substrate-binding protein